MNKTLLLKAAVSAVALTATLAACKSAATGGHIASASSARTVDPRVAAAANAKAVAAFRAGDPAKALDFAEQAVAAAPNDAGYRATLADIYLRQGRFQSAEAAYRDALTLDPGERHAELSLILCQIATGNRAGAIASLDMLADSVPASDLGLAYALAGQPQRAIALLEPAARLPLADSRIRQNLAFAYALAGDWRKAKTIAAQDLSPSELGPRLAQWAALASPATPADQVAALLGVRPAAGDPGQPERLALARPQTETQLASADPVPAAPAAAPAPAPQVAAAAPIAPAPQAAPTPQTAPAVQVAEAAPAPAPQAEPQTAPAPAPAPASVAPVRLASASSDLPAWMVAVAHTKDSKPAAHPVQAHPAHQPLLRRASLDRGAVPGFTRAPTTEANGRFVVQLGSFHSAPALERAWVGAVERFGFADRTPLATTIDLPSRGTFHRLSVAGFDTRRDATHTCETIRAKGGACFVRAVAGDAAPQWASRHVRHGTRLASR